jgi:hypothetical protein
MRIDDVDTLILNDPAEYERLLHSYTLLLGERKLWWQRVAEAESEAWPAAIRRAITSVARKSALEPHTLAKWLDVAELPATRMRIIELARERMSR